MREIKFRGKRITNGDWLYGDLMHVNEQVLIHPIFAEAYQYDDDYDENVIPETVGQVTGLKDRNGKEIYEGDIVRVMRDYYEQHVVCYDIHQAKYKTVPFGAYTANAGNGGWTGYELRGYGEVIGNIYEHPHLLKEESTHENIS